MIRAVYSWVKQDVAQKTSQRVRGNYNVQTRCLKKIEYYVRVINPIPWKIASSPIGVVESLRDQMQRGEMMAVVYKKDIIQSVSNRKLNI